MMPSVKSKIASRSLRHRVQLQQWDETGPDSRGQPDGSWVTIASVWAKIEQMRARDTEVANMPHQQTMYRVVIRYHQSATKAKRLVHSGRVFAIVSVSDLRELNWWQVLICSEET